MKKKAGYPAKRNSRLFLHKAIIEGFSLKTKALFRIL